MELLQLRYFFETAKSQNIAKTAENHWVPASSVSASIKRLEEELGCKLFERHSNKIELNENGKRLQRSLCLVFDELDNAVSELKTKPCPTQEIRIFAKAIRHIIIDKISEFRKFHPETTFKTHFNLEDKNYTNFDVIIDEDCDDYAEFLKVELLSRKLYIRASANSPFKNKTIRLKDLRHQPFITMGEHSNLYKKLVKACKNAGFTPNVVLETNDGACFSRSIKNGIGMGITRSSTSNNDFSVINVVDFDERQTVYAFFKDDNLSPIVKKFIETLKETK